ncbi:hypothetical protein SAY86_025587 [Trapa natans]|uniref:Hydroxyproline-rich glycoprotein family protein n=1 Tax=Trapa natans TaxID=22666 RepID=A0AAN7RE80_TRANT|nr:hypothetical protein SAY86_025587 [Trapa natans]
MGMSETPNLPQPDDDGGNGNRSKRIRISHPPAVPFLWEVRPGIPKKDWKPDQPPSSPPPISPASVHPHPVKLIADEKKPGITSSFSSPRSKLIDSPPLLLLHPPLLDTHGEDDDTIGSSYWRADTITEDPPRSFIHRAPSRRPVKLVASVPFVWEEKPGKPLPCFSPSPPHDMNVSDHLLLPLPPLPPPPPSGSWSSYDYEEEEEEEEAGSSSICNNNNNVADGDADEEGAYRPDVRSFKFGISECPPVRRLPSSRPVKLVASVPFVWEERPGKPLSSFPQVPVHPNFDLCDDLKGPGPAPAADKRHHQEGMFEWEIESFRFETDDDDRSSSSTTHSLPLLPAANCFMPSAISTALPLGGPPHSTNDNCLKKLEPSSSCSSSSTSTSDLEKESDASSSYYGTEASGPVGSAFLEWLFPLFPPRSGILDRSGSRQRHTLAAAAASSIAVPEGGCLGIEASGSLIMTGPVTTLGELIMMSRRSCRRKAAAVHMRKHNSSIREFTKRTGFGCGVLGHKIIQGLNLKRQPRLKLA